MAFAPQTRIVRATLDVVERIGRQACPEDPFERRGARRMAHARAAIDVVRADDGPREFLGDVVVFVRRPRRAEHADAVGAVAVDAEPAAARDEARGPRPRNAPPPIALARMIGSVIAIGRVRRSRRRSGPSRRDAPCSPARRARAEPRRYGRPACLHTFRSRRHNTDRSCASIATASAAVEAAAVFERARRTGIDTRAAADARALAQAGAVRHDRASPPALAHMPHALALDLVADADAAVAIDAARHIDGQIRMRVDRSARCRPRRARHPPTHRRAARGGTACPETARPPPLGNASPASGSATDGAPQAPASECRSPSRPRPASHRRGRVASDPSG